MTGLKAQNSGSVLDLFLFISDWSFLGGLKFYFLSQNFTFKTELKVGSEDAFTFTRRLPKKNEEK